MKMDQLFCWVALKSFCWFSRHSFSLSSVTVSRCSKIETVCKREDEIISAGNLVARHRAGGLCMGEAFRLGHPPFCSDASERSLRTGLASGPYHKVRHSSSEQTKWKVKMMHSKKKEQKVRPLWPACVASSKAPRPGGRLVDHWSGTKATQHCGDGSEMPYTWSRCYWKVATAHSATIQPWHTTPRAAQMGKWPDGFENMLIPEDGKVLKDCWENLVKQCMENA